jgi:pre-mRNA-splicing factor SYF1
MKEVRTLSIQERERERELELTPPLTHSPGVAMFHYPYVFDLWVAYLTKFIERYGGSKLERARDMFEQAIDGVPAKYAKPLYLMYAHVEEQHGLARHAMNVYDR